MNLPNSAANTYPTAVSGKTKLKSATPRIAIRSSIARISIAMPTATRGLTIARRYDSGFAASVSEKCLVPQASDKFPNARSSTKTPSSEYVR